MVQECRVVMAMNPRNDLLVMTEETGTADVVASAIGKNGGFAEHSVCATLQELAERIEPLPPTAVLVDIDHDPARKLSELEALVSRFSKTRFIVIASDRRDDLMLEAMQIGARHFLLKTSIPADLKGVLDRLAPPGSSPLQEAGTLVTVLSGGGGCGATTLSVNLANEFCVDSSDSALIVDLDCGYGTVANYLGLQGEYGIPDILNDRARIDSELVRSTALSYSSRLHAVINPVGLQREPPDAIAFEHLDAALSVFKRTYRFTVVDAPRLATDVLATLVDASDIVLLPFQLVVKDIRHVRAMLSALREVCTSAPQIDLVATRYNKRRTMVTLKEAALALDYDELTSLRNDFASASKAMNFGQPLAQATPLSRLRRDIAKLAHHLRARPRNTGRSGAYVP